MTAYSYPTASAAAIGEDIRPIPHTAGGSAELTEAEAAAYLDGSGYQAETADLLARTQKFPGNYQYTADRHRYAAFIVPAGCWRAGDCARSEDRIRSSGAGRRPYHCT